MKLTSNGKLLFRIAGSLLVLSFIAATMSGDGSFIGFWMAFVSGFSLLGGATTAIMGIVDTLLENEE